VTKRSPNKHLRQKPLVLSYPKDHEEKMRLKKMMRQILVQRNKDKSNAGIQN